MALEILKRVLLPAAIVAALVYVFTNFLPKAYASYETLYFPLSASSGAGALSALAGGASGGDAGAISGLNGAIVYPLIASGSATAAGIIDSHSCHEYVATALDLPDKWHTDLIKATDRLAKDITSESDKTGLLVVRVLADSPQLAVDINREVYVYLRQRTEELSASAGSSNRKLIENQLAEAERERNAAEANVVAVMRRAPLSSVADVQRNYLDAQKALADAEVSRDQERARLTTLEEEYRRLASAPQGTDQLNALTTLNPAFAQLAQELQRRRLELEDAMIALSPMNPQVYRARQAYRNAERISSEAKAGLNDRNGITSPDIIRARAELSALEESVKANQSVLSTALARVSLSPRQYAETTIAKGNFDAALTRVSYLEQELEKASIIQNRTPAQFDVIDQPYVDPTPTSPRKLLYTGVAFVAVAAICLLPFLGRTLRSVATSAESARLEATA